MKYYKIVQDNTIVGVINSDDFIRYQAVNKLFIGADESTGDFINYNNKTYRSLWMKPLEQEFNIPYEIANVLEISENEYNELYKAMEKNETIQEETEEENLIPSNNIIIPDTSSLDFIRSSKLKEMSYECRITIESGIDMEIRGETKHFSLSAQDQINLMNFSVTAQADDLIPYHADGEECTFYTAEEIKQIAAAANTFKIYHTTYYNALKNYINALDTIEDIAAITYGTPIPEEYKTEVLKTLE